MPRMPAALLGRRRLRPTRLEVPCLARRGLARDAKPEILPFAALSGNNPTKKPRLPVPPLEATRARYLRSLGGLGLSAAEQARQEALAAKALSGPAAEKLQREVEEAYVRRGEDSYIQRIWDDLYLGGRWATPVNSNPFHELALFANNADNARAGAATATGLLRWMHRLRTEGLALRGDGRDAMRCPRQLARQVGAGRVAQEGRDRLVFAPAARHIVVLCDGMPYKVEVFGADGVQASPGRLYRALQRMLQEAAENLRHEDEMGRFERDVGLLTSLDRAAWAKHRRGLEASDSNRRVLDAIDGALFVLNLDLDESTHDEGRADALLRGIQRRNRWFDKHQLIVLGDASVGMNFEHAFSDGLAWQEMLDDTVRHAQELWASDDAFAAPAADDENHGVTDEVPVERLAWMLDADQRAACVEAAEQENSCDIAVLRDRSFGKKAFKAWGLAPDAAFQLSLRAAYARLHPEAPHAATYESCATSRFLAGRTETIRSATAEAAAFAARLSDAALLETPADRLATREAGYRAAERHVQLTKEAARGEGVDRHLTALAVAAAAQGVAGDAAFELFRDPTFAASRNWILSTSNLSPPWPFIRLFGFGPVTPKGYGVGYLIHEDAVDVSLTHFKGQGTDAQGLRRKLVEVWEDMDRVFRD